MTHFRPLPVLSAVVLLALAALIALGTWQLRRAGEKRAIVAALTAAASLPPLPFGTALANLKSPVKSPASVPEWHAIAPPAGQICGEATPGLPLQPLLVSEAGRREYLLPVGDPVSGYMLVHLAEGPAGVQHLPRPCAFSNRLVLRKRALPGRFTIPNHPENNEFYWIDPDAMLRRAGLAVAAPGYYLAAPEILDTETGAKRPNPRADPLAAQLLRPETHIGYALTWFGLAIALVALYIAMHVVRGRLSFQHRNPE